MIEEIDMGEMKLPNLLILPCFGEEGGGMKRNEAGGIKKAPDASRTEGFELFCISAPQGYGDFCLMGNDKPQPHFHILSAAARMRFETSQSAPRSMFFSSSVNPPTPPLPSMPSSL